MGSTLTEALSYVDATRDALPTTTGTWMEVGTAGAVARLADGWSIAKTNTSQRWLYWSRVREQDTNLSPSRPGDVLEFAFTLQQLVVLGGSTDYLVATLSDGVKSAQVAFYGSGVIQWIDNSYFGATPAVVASIVPDADTLSGDPAGSSVWDMWRRRRYILRKERGEGFELWCDGRLVAKLPYGMAPPPRGGPTATGAFDADVTCAYAMIGFGVQTTTSGTFLLDELEVGLNQRVSEGWRLDRLVADLPVSVQRRLPHAWRQVARATAAIFAGPMAELRRVVGLYTAQRQFDIVNGRAYRRLRRGVLPANEVPAWSTRALGGSMITSARERTRFTHAGGTVEIYKTWPSNPYLSGIEFEQCARATITLISSTPDGGAGQPYRFGPTLLAEDGTKAASATYLHEVASDRYAVSLLSDDPAGATSHVAAGVEAWPINPFRPNRIEVYLFAPDWALLVVNGQVVQKVAYDDLPASGRGRICAIGDYHTGASVWDVEDAEIWRKVFDRSRRELFLQDTVERGYALGGCERNDELEEWARNWSGVHEIRGTTHNIRAELARLACSVADTAVRVEEAYAEWYLETSWPDITPIYLDADGLLRTITAEFPDSVRNMTPQQVADWLARYVLPVSTLEFQYHAALAYKLTAGTSVVGDYTRVTIASTAFLAAGDEVELVAVGTNVVTRTTVVTVVSATQVDVVLVTAHLLNDVLRKVLATS